MVGRYEEAWGLRFWSLFGYGKGVLASSLPPLPFFFFFFSFFPLFLFFFFERSLAGRWGLGFMYTTRIGTGMAMIINILHGLYVSIVVNV